MKHDLFNSYQTFKTGSGEDGVFYSLPKLEEAAIGKISPPSGIDPCRSGIGSSQF